MKIDRRNYKQIVNIFITLDTIITHSPAPYFLPKTISWSLS